MTTLTEEKINGVLERGCTAGDVKGVIGNLVDEAMAGDVAAKKLLHGLDFQQQLSKALMSDIKNAIRVLGLPASPVACIAASLASVIETIGVEIAPNIHKEFDEIRAELAATPQIIADRAKGQENFDARIAFSKKCRDEGLSDEETKRRVGELYNAQLKDFIASNDAEEALAS